MACSGSEPLIRSQDRFCNGVSGLGIPEDPVVVAPGDIVFGEIHSRVQDKAAGALPKQFNHKIIEPAGGRLVFPFR